MLEELNPQVLVRAAPLLEQLCEELWRTNIIDEYVAALRRQNPTQPINQWIREEEQLVILEEYEETNGCKQARWSLALFNNQTGEVVDDTKIEAVKEDENGLQVYLDLNEQEIKIIKVQSIRSLARFLLRA